MADQMQAVRDTIFDILRKNGVKRAAFFGSIVRGEMDEESDIDILIEFEGRKSLLDRRYCTRGICGCASCRG